MTTLLDAQVRYVPAPALTPGAGATPVLSVRDLHTHFHASRGLVKAVDGVSFDLLPGQRLAIVGESGSGKSVTAMSLLRLIGYPGKIAGGQVLLNGRDVLGLSTNELNAVRGREVAMVFQDAMTALNPVLRVSDQITAPMRRHLGISAAEARRRGIEFLRQVGIPAPETRFDAYPHQLSGGMRQRVMIAMALSCNPKLLIADEPTTALDVTIQAQIVELLKRLSDAHGTAVLFITHDMGLVARFADLVAVMYAGRIVEIGPAATLFENPRHPYTQGLLRSIPPMTGPRPDRLMQIEGAPPDLAKPITGCAFAARCLHTVQRCLVDRPPLLPLSAVQEMHAGHATACWVQPDPAVQPPTSMASSGVAA